MAFQVTGRKEDWEKWEKSVVSLFLVCVSVFFASADFIHSSSSSFRSLDTVVSSSPNIKNLSSSFESTPRCQSSHFVNYFLFGFVIILICVSFSPSLLLLPLAYNPEINHNEPCWRMSRFLIFIRNISSTNPYYGRRGAGAYPSYHTARGRVHPGQITSLSQG